MMLQNLDFSKNHQVLSVKVICLTICKMLTLLGCSLILTLLSIALVMQLLLEFFIFQVRWLQLQQSVKSSGKYYQTSMLA